MKQKLFKIYGLLHSLKYIKILSASIKSIFNQETLSDAQHIKMASNWLLYMQNSDGGYSRKFSFINGRDISYIETTGYIIPTLIDVGKKYNEPKYINSALKAGEFLINVQNDDGSFSEIDGGKPLAFDTGQCLIGLNCLYKYTNNNQYLNALKKASFWLVNNQEKNASWERVAYNNIPHTYYTRVASAILKSANILENEMLKDGALKNIEWVLDNQLDNGYFKYSSFDKNTSAYLHTLIYILEGLLDIFDMTKDKKILNAVIKNADNFKDINLKRDLVLCSQYDENFRCVNNERCITGLAQWAGVALRLYELTSDNGYKICAINTLYYLKAKQLKSSKMRGSFSASIPFWGKYGGFDFVNWSNKFFIDSMLLYQKYSVSKEKEQSSYVGVSFCISSSVVTNTLSYMDKKYIKRLKNILPKNKKIKVLDLGCGKGVIIKELEQEFPLIDFYGIDPIFESENIKKGDAYNIEFENDFFDIVMSFEVLQHTILKSALTEIYRVVKKDGVIIIGERNPYSILGMLKPSLELIGRWMYPFDSAFREKWYTKSIWIYHLKRAGFNVESIDEIQGDGKRFVNRYFFIRCFK